MILKITNINFTTEFKWLFLLHDSEQNEYLIMDEHFYFENGLKTPVTKKELDMWDIGHRINCQFKTIEKLNIITSFT